RKRALANGGGLLRSSPDSEELLRVILEAPNFTTGSALMHILGEGFVLTLFRNGEMFALTPVEKKIFRLCMQDEARHVAYGTMHLKYFLEKHPEREPEIHDILQRGEEATFSLNQTQDTVEARAILAGGGLEYIDEGFKKLNYLFKKQIHEYLYRLKIAGIDRTSRIAIPLELPI
ncbi:MAG: ferritin-like domain-containing protein, partial [Candidatus Binataceae bacterium]